MPLEPHERNEIDRLWTQTNANTGQLQELSVKQEVWTAEIKRMNKDQSESSGRVAGQLDTMNSTIQGLSRSLTILETQGTTKGGLVDRWGPLLFSAVTLIFVVASFMRDAP